MNGAWRSLEEVRGLAAVAAEWRQHTGADFEAFKAGFLQKAGRNARSVPCPHKAGCTHEVRPRGRGFVGVCKDDDGTGCDDILLTQEEVEVWEVNLARLGRAIAQALKCDPKDAKLGLDRTRQIASLGDAPLPIVLTVQHDGDGFGDVVAQLVARFQKGFILLAPTSRFCTAPATELLGRVNAGFFSLEAHFSLTAQGNVQARKGGMELFGRFVPEAKEAVPEDVARQAFRLIEQLDSEQVTKPPTVLAVFRLYCVKEMTAEQVARKCGCAKGTVINRLKLIREKTKMEPDELRRFSSQFDKIEDDIRESKATHIHRKRMIDDSPSGEEGE
jgi:hypothetical protein